MKLPLSSLVLFSSLFLVMFQFTLHNQPVENPRDTADMVNHFLQKIPSLPRYAEGGYSPLGRSPVVDVLLADPLYMPTYAEIVVELIKNNNLNPSLFSLSSSLLTAGGIPSRPIKESLNFPDDVPHPFLDVFPESSAKKLHGYWHSFISIHEEVENTLNVLSDEEKTWVKENYNGFFFGKQESDSGLDFFTTDNPYPLKFFELASRVNLAKLSDSARRLSLIFDDFNQSREEFSSLMLKEDFIWEEKGLKFSISQKSHAEHEENADFFIDLGGFNTIRNNAGGTEGSHLLALHIDLKGHNTYYGRNFVQGSGFLGVGMLASCSGNNTYQAEFYSQGCGFFGAGFLVNLEGNNRFVLNFGGQSFALFGSSLLWNKEGKNEYLASKGMAQAASSTLGVAFLIDNQGGNSYIVREGGIGQGGSSGVRAYPWLNNPSFYGGLSFMYIGGGDNKLKNVSFAQGSAYFLGAGILVAEGSHDLFEADYDAQGQGLHLASGLLLKKGSHNQFKGGWGSLGVSGDRSVGMFISLGGNNDYESTEQSIGTSRKPKSLGMFLTMGGENTYQFQQLSNARLEFPQSPKDWSSALFLEIGKDSYYPAHVDEFKRGNGMHWGVENHSLGLSTPSFDQNLFHSSPQIPYPFDPIQGWQNNVAYRDLNTFNDPQNLADELTIASYDRRRQIYETLDLIRFQDRKRDVNLSHLLNPESPEDAFNYAVLWALRNKDRIDLTEVKKALSNESFNSEYSRKMAVNLVGTFWTEDATPLLAKIMLQDPSEEIRYFAALSLSLHLPENSTKILEQGLKSNSEIVRFAIVKGLQESKNPSALKLVLPLFKDESFYVRRAAGLTALSLEDMEGVPVILETLQFETLDTKDNYGDNIYNQMAKYLDVDFGLDKQAWIDWWKERKG